MSQSDVTSTDDQEGISVPAATGALHFKEPSLEFEDGASSVPSGKHTKNYGKSPFLMGKLTINGHVQ